MKNIDRIIRLKCFEIVIAVFFIAISFQFWNSLHHGEVMQMYELAQKNPSYAYVDVVQKNTEVMYPISDEKAMQQLVPYQVQMINDTYLETNYVLGIRVRKSSTLDYHTLKIALDKNVSFLANYFVDEDDEYYYFRLDDGNLKASSKLYDIKIWISDDVITSIDHRSLAFDFVNLANILL